jgi:O-antigen ligase/polysaccharide polymerase Wzy-like membrane protein
MDEAGLAQIAGIVGAAGAALAILAGRRITLVSGFVLLAVAEALLAVSMAGTDALDKVASPTALAAVVAGLILVAASAAVFVRFPLLTIPALVLAAPFRLPFDFDRDHRFFFALAEGGRLGRLIPLYAVLTASAAAFLYRSLRRDDVVAPPRVIAVPAAAFLALVSLSLLWSEDVDRGANLLAYFLLPFAAMVAVVARAELAQWLPKALAVIAIGLATVFALVGLLQQATKELLFYEPELQVANAYSPFFRVTSLFTDPSLYGRHLVLGFAVLLVLLWATRIHVAAAAALGAVMFAGLYFSYSQSSMAALFVVAAAVTLVAGDPVARRTVAVVTAVVVVIAAGFVAVQARDQSIRELTSGRWQRADLTIDVVREHPLLGVGLGAQPKVSRELGAGNDAREARFVSHTTPLTVAAELGLVGVALYLFLLAGTIRMLFALRQTWPVLALALGAVLLALFTHALAYSGFFEDPITWLALGVGAAYLALPAPVREGEPAPVPTGQVQAEPVPSAR